MSKPISRREAIEELNRQHRAMVEAVNREREEEAAKLSCADCAESAARIAELESENERLREGAESWRLERLLAQRGWFQMHFAKHGWSIQRRLGNGMTEPCEPDKFYDTPEAAVRAAAASLGVEGTGD